jgi:hypothetical protein
MFESSKEKPQQKLTGPELVIKLKEIQQGIALLIVNLRENIQALDDDPDVQDRMRSIQSDAEKRANNLEEEVKRLRCDVKNIKDLLDDSVEKKNPIDL